MVQEAVQHGSDGRNVAEQSSEDQVADRPFGVGKTMTRTMGDLDKTQLRPFQSDFLRSLGKKTRFTLHGEFTIGYNF